MITEHVSASSEEISTLPGAASDDMLAWGADARSGWSHIVDELLAMYAMKDDWDGLGAEAPCPSLVRSAMHLVRLLRELPANPIPSRVVPTPIGTILFEWHPAGRYEEWEITEPYMAHCMLAQAESSAQHSEVRWKPAQYSQDIASEQPLLANNGEKSEQNVSSELLYQAA